MYKTNHRSHLSRKKITVAVTRKNTHVPTFEQCFPDTCIRSSTDRHLSVICLARKMTTRKRAWGHEIIEESICIFLICVLVEENPRLDL